MTSADLQLVAMAIEARTVKGPPTTCWSWQGWTARGYPSITVHGRNYRAARAVVALAEGLNLDDHAWVARHTCDQPGCVNPAHLISGTNGDNQRDAHARRRRTSPFAKLTREQVAMVRMASLDSTVYLAKLFGVSRETISRIRNGRTWPHG